MFIYTRIKDLREDNDLYQKVCGFYREKEIRHDDDTVAADETGRTYQS